MKSFIKDFASAWTRVRHEKVAKWTLIVHIIYYGHASLAQWLPWLNTHMAHFVTSAVCGIFLTWELSTKDTTTERRHK